MRELSHNEKKLLKSKITNYKKQSNSGNKIKTI